MSNTTFKFPLTNTLFSACTAVGSVSGDVTTITSITYSASSSEWLFATSPDKFPSVTIIDGKQYRWQSKKTTTNALGKTYVSSATLNIGTKLVIQKPYFTVLSGTDPTSDPITRTCSFYNLGNLNPLSTLLSWDHGASDFEIDGKTAVPITIEDDSENNGMTLTTDAKYKFTWTLGTKTYSTTKTLGSKATKIAVSYTVPKSWNSALPSATSGTFQIKVESIFGTYTYQTKTATVKATVPDDCVPVINSVTLADTNGRVPSSWGMFVEEQSNVAISAIDITTSYNATIKRVVMEVADKTYSGTTSSLPSSKVFSTYGVMQVTVTVTDTRNRTAEKSAYITVVEYDPPTLDVDSMRCDSSGSIENEGTYFLATTSTTYSTCNGKNAITLTAAYKLSSASTYGSATSLTTGEAVETVLAGDLDTEYSYDVQYVLKDQFNTVTVIDYVSTAVYLMHFLHGGRGVAFGGKATVDNCADFIFDAIFRGDVEFEKSNGETVTITQIINALGL